MDIKNYSVSKDTAALISCLEELSTVHEHIYEALSLHYDENQIGYEDKVGGQIFSKLFEVRKEVFEIIREVIEENLSSITSGDKEI